MSDLSLAKLRQAEKTGKIDIELAQEIIDTLPAFMHWFRSEMRKLASCLNRLLSDA
jgi:hypothetical protein